MLLCCNVAVVFDPVRYKIFERHSNNKYGTYIQAGIPVVFKIQNEAHMIMQVIMKVQK